jgi:hypothetical protein
VCKSPAETWHLSIIQTEELLARAKKSSVKTVKKLDRVIKRAVSKGVPEEMYKKTVHHAIERSVTKSRQGSGAQPEHPVGLGSPKFRQPDFRTKTLTN